MFVIFLTSMMMMHINHDVGWWHQRLRLLHRIICHFLKLIGMKGTKSHPLYGSIIGNKRFTHPAPLLATSIRRSPHNEPLARQLTTKPLKKILSRLKYLEEEFRQMKDRGMKMPEEEFDIGRCFDGLMEETLDFSWRPPRSPSPVEIQVTTQQTNDQVRKPDGTIRQKMKERKNKEVVEPIDVDLHTPAAPKLKTTRPVRGLKKSQYLRSPYVLVQSTPRFRVADEELIPNPPTFFSELLKW